MKIWREKESLEWWRLEREVCVVRSEGDFDGVWGRGNHVFFKSVILFFFWDSIDIY